MTVVDLVRILRRNWVFLFIGALVGLLAAGAYTFTRPTTYQASTTGVVVAGQSLAPGDALTANSVTVQRASLYAGLVNSAKVSAGAREILKGTPQANATGSVSAAVQQVSPFLVVTASSSSAQNAQALANATLLSLKAEALRLETFPKTRGQGDQSEARLEQLTGIHVLVYSPATTPSTPVRANVNRNLAGGLLIGLAVGALIALVRRAFDVRLRTQNDVEELTGKSVLGVIPTSKQLKQRGGGRQAIPSGAAGEAMRQLRTNLRFVNVDHPPRSIVITSPAPGDGKSTLAAHLARLIASSGQSVILVDCDLRLPTQGEQFAVDRAVGLTQVLSGDIPVSDALVKSGLPDLTLLPAGRTPPNPSELLGSNAMRDLVRQLSAHHIVLLDAPPLLAVTDAALLGAASDGVILVTRVGRTHKLQVKQSALLLTQAKATLLGTVMNLASAKRMGETVYGYGSYGDQGKYQQYYTAPVTIDDAESREARREGRRRADRSSRA